MPLSLKFIPRIARVNIGALAYSQAAISKIVQEKVASPTNVAASHPKANLDNRTVMERAGVWSVHYFGDDMMDTKEKLREVGEKPVEEIKYQKE